MRAWKWIGVAGIAGVAATGVVVARAERERRAYEPDDVRARLQERVRAVQETPPAPASEASVAHAAAAEGGTTASERLRSVWSRVRSRRRSRRRG